MKALIDTCIIIDILQQRDHSVTLQTISFTPYQTTN